MVATLLFGLIGFVDDYSKIAKQRSLGLTGRQKLLAQLLVAVMVWAVLFLSTRFWGGNDYSWNFSIPFIKATDETLWSEFHRTVPVFGVDCGRAVGIIERSEFD